MKRQVFFLVFLSLVLIISFEVYLIQIKEKENSITGNVVTGNATASNLGVSISVVGGNPYIKITSPENKTYITKENLWLNYSSSGTQSVWYNIDNSTNLSLTGNLMFNTSDGVHNMYIYANNSSGTNASDNVSFTVNTNKIKVDYSDYSGDTAGRSTQFNLTPYEDLMNLSGITLENTNYGRIQFNEEINVTDDANFSDYEVNLDAYINISNNSILINDTELPNFNKSATLYLYNLSFSNPTILMNGGVCPSNICTKISYSNGTLIFNVTWVGQFSAEETPKTPTSGGGGAGVGVANIDINTGSLYVKIQQGETKSETFIVTDTGTANADVTLGTSGIESFVKMNESEFELTPGESRMINIDFLAEKDTDPDVYIGKIIVKSGSIEKDILVAIDVGSAQGLFDVNVNIPDQYLTVERGGQVVGDVHIYNLGNLGRIDANVTYTVKDENGNTITSQNDTVAVETQVEYLKTLNVPRDAKPGKYVFYVQVTYDSKIADASAFFDVINAPLFGIKTGLSTNEEIYISIALLLIIIGIVVYIIKKRRKKKRILTKKSLFK